MVDILWADVLGCSAPDQENSGHSQFVPLKLRSLTVVPSSGARCAPPNYTLGSSTARLFLPGSATPVTDSRPFRAPAPPVPYASVCTLIEGSTNSSVGVRKRSACGWFIPPPPAPRSGCLPLPFPSHTQSRQETHPVIPLWLPKGRRYRPGDAVLTRE